LQLEAFACARSASNTYTVNPDPFTKPGVPSKFAVERGIDTLTDGDETGGEGAKLGAADAGMLLNIAVGDKDGVA